MLETVSPIANQNKKLLLKNFVWKEKFNDIVLSISRKINSNNHDYSSEINYIEEILIPFCTSKVELNTMTDLEKDFLLRWSRNTIIILECAAHNQYLSDLIINCVTYNPQSINAVGWGHDDDAQYSFSMLCVLDRIKIGKSEMTEKEIVEKVETVYEFMNDHADEPSYYDILKKMVSAINKELYEEKIEGLTRFQKIHLFSWCCNIHNLCEFALLIKEEPTMIEERRLMIQAIIADLLGQSHKNFNLFKNIKAFNETQ